MKQPAKNKQALLTFALAGALMLMGMGCGDNELDFEKMNVIAEDFATVDSLEIRLSVKAKSRLIGIDHHYLSFEVENTGKRDRGIDYCLPFLDEFFSIYEVVNTSEGENLVFTGRVIVDSWAANFGPVGTGFPAGTKRTFTAPLGHEEIKEVDMYCSIDLGPTPTNYVELKKGKSYTSFVDFKRRANDSEIVKLRVNFTL